MRIQNPYRSTQLDLRYDLPMSRTVEGERITDQPGQEG